MRVVLVGDPPFELMKKLSPDYRPPIKSAWPTPIGKKLTDRMITKYAKKGFYGTNMEARKAAKESNTSKRKMSRLMEEFV